MAWLALSRRDITAAVNIFAQVTRDPFKPEHINGLNKLVDNAKAHSGIGLAFPISNAETIHLVAYSDASFPRTLTDLLNQDSSSF